MLVGINLLREGLDLPEVSLVAVLDADKEGFLRSSRSLIQTIGRAARNINGRAILYADKTTGAMREAMDETDRRRRRQSAHNRKHGVTPRGVQKAVKDIIDGVAVREQRRGRALSKVAEEAAIYNANPGALAKLIAKLEKEMFACAKNLEFEKAAELRDRVHLLKERGFKEVA